MFKTIGLHFTRRSAEDSPSSATKKAKHRDDPTKLVKPTRSHKVEANFDCRFGKKIARIFIGTDTEPYIVHNDLISASSDFFDKALNGQFKESGGNVYLPEKKSKIFDVYQRWLYSGQIDIVEQHPEEVCWVLIDLYILGDGFQDEGFCNAVIDRVINFVETSERFPVSPSYMQKVYKNTPEGSKPRKLVVDFWLYPPALDWFEISEVQALKGEFPLEFWFEVSRGLMKQRVENSKTPSLNPWVSNPCQYHSHTKPPKCT